MSEEFEIIDNYKKLNIAKVTDIIFDLFNIGVNNSNFIKKLYSELEEDLNSEEIYPKKVESEKSNI